MVCGIERVRCCEWCDAMIHSMYGYIITNCFTTCGLFIYGVVLWSVNSQLLLTMASSFCSWTEALKFGTLCFSTSAVLRYVYDKQQQKVHVYEAGWLLRIRVNELYGC